MNLQALIAANENKAHSLYAVIDAAADENLLNDFWSYEHGQDIVSLFWDIPETKHLTLAPHFLKISSLTPLAEHLIKHSQEHFSGIFIVGDNDFWKAYKQAQSWLTGILANNDKMFFRFYDPRLLLAYGEFYEKQNLSVPLAPFYKMFFFDRTSGRCRTFEASEAQNEAFGPVRISPGLEECLREAALVNRLVYNLEEYSSETVSPFGISQRYQIVRASLAWADAKALMTEEDLYLACRLTFEYGYGFLHHLKISKAVESRGLVNFSQTVKDFPSDWWAEARGMNQNISPANMQF